MVLLLSRWFV